MNQPLQLLIVEDNPADYRLLERYLHQHGLPARCQCVSTLAELQAALAERPWDAVLSDYSVPRLDFQETLQQLQAFNPDLPLILVSGSIGEETAVELLKRGVWDFVLKDNLARLPSVVERSLRDAAGRRARRQAEIALRESEERLRLALKAANQGLYDLNVQTGEAKVSPEYATMLGYDPADFHETNARWIERLHPDDHAATAAAFRAYIAGETDEYRVEFRQRTQDGQWKWILSIGSIVERDAASQPLRMLGTHTDITWRKQGEEAAMRWQKAFESVAFGLARADCATNSFLEVNATFARQRGYRPEELVGQPLLFIYPPEEHAAMAARFQIIDRTGHLAFESVHLCKDGRRLPVFMEVATITDHQQRPVSRVAYAVDITERKQAEQALAEEHNLVCTILDNVPDMVFTKDLQGCIISCNQAATNFFGQPAAALAHKSVFEMNPADLAQGYHEDDQRVLREGATILNREEQIANPAGERLWFLTTKAPLRDAEGKLTGLVTICRDITERKRLAQQRESIEAQLRHQQKLEAIGTLAAGVAHEINNPINGVMNYAQLILDASGADAERAEYAREIIHESERVATIVRNLLRFARQEKDGSSPARVADIFERTLSLMRALFKRDQIALQMDLPDDLPEVQCRSQQIQQVLMNLLTNARDAINAKYPAYHADKRIILRAQAVAPAAGGAACADRQAPPAVVRITVEDHGPGIPPELHERIYDPFFTTKPRDVGTGLGLSISHGIVKDHGGRLWFETEPGQWTKFHFELPLA